MIQQIQSFINSDSGFRLAIVFCIVCIVTVFINLIKKT